MTDANRTEAQAELRQVISDAFSSQTLWTTDWAGVQLQRQAMFIFTIMLDLCFSTSSLLPKPLPNFGLKRKR